MSRSRHTYWVVGVLIGIWCCWQGPTAAAAAASSALPGTHDASSDEMVTWIKQHGGQVSVAIRRTPGGGRGTFAPTALKPGDVLAAIPVELVYASNYSFGTGFEAGGAQLVIDMANETSFWQPYLKTLPPIGSVVNHAFIPDSYLAIVQDENMEKAIRAHHHNIKYYCGVAAPSYEALGLQVNNTQCAHAAALLTTRTFSYGGTEVLLPVVDMANHQNDCQHTHRVEPCDPKKAAKQRKKGLAAPALPPSFAKGVSSSSSSGTAKGGGGVSGVCITWRAETALAAGEEVCNCYGLLMQDHALLQYGFLQAGPIAHELSMLDRPEHSQEYADTWDKPEAEWGQALPAKFTGAPRNLRGRLLRLLVDRLGLRGGTSEQLQAEVDRLRERLKRFTDAEPSLAAIQPDGESDPDGTLLSLLREWRRQRLAAIEFEIQRLEAILAVNSKQDEL